MRSGDAVVVFTERVADPAERLDRRQGAVVGERADWWGFAFPCVAPASGHDTPAERLTERAEHPKVPGRLFVASEGRRSGW